MKFEKPHVLTSPESSSEQVGAFIAKFGCTKENGGLDEKVGKHSNFTYRDFLNFHLQILFDNQALIVVARAAKKYHEKKRMFLRASKHRLMPRMDFRG